MCAERREKAYRKTFMTLWTMRKYVSVCVSAASATGFAAELFNMPAIVFSIKKLRHYKSN